MPKSLILGLSVLALAVSGFFLYRFVTAPVPNGNAGVSPDPKEVKFNPDFLNEMDANGDGRITWKEFKTAYNAEGASKLTVGANKTPLTAKAAFSLCDVNDDGKIDRVDRRTLDHRAWAAFRAETLEKGLGPIVWEDKWLALNTHQASWLDDERGAIVQGTLPFRGNYFRRAYFGRWAQVTEQDGRNSEGFVSFDDDRPGKLFLLRTDGQIRVLKTDRVTIKDLPDHPSTVFFNALLDLKGKLSDVQKNHAIAVDCERDGLEAEAVTMYRRALIFDRTNAKALRALGYRMDGVQYVPAD